MSINIHGMKADNKLGLDLTKPIFWVSDKSKLKPVSSATETSYKIESLLVAGLDMIYFQISQ